MTLSINDVKEGFVAEHEAFLDLVSGLTEEEWNAPSNCAGWTNGDVARHITGTLADILAGRMEGLGTAEVTEREVEERRSKNQAEMVEELREVLKGGQEMLGLFDESAWNSPSPGGYEGTLLQGVEALYYDAYMHANDIRLSLGRPVVRGEGVRSAVHHIAFELEKRNWGPATLAFDGVEEVKVGDGGKRVTGDPMDFILAATGRSDPKTVGLDESVNIYAA